ncbi:MAG: peptidase T [Acidobacteriota bacterium]
MSDPMSFRLGEAEKKDLLERFLRYVRIDTRSSETSETYPSTPGQWDLLRLLQRELLDLGLQDVELDANGYLFGTFPGNLPEGRTAPVVGFLAHVDTYPATPGDGVVPQILPDYDGGDIVLKGDPSRTILASKNPLLQRCVGDTIITSDGTTLLGADDKAGIAEILTGIDCLRRHPEILHGPIRVGFTPDEETGNGTKYFDVKRFGAEAAYTFDGSILGEVEVETFCADSATVTVTGIDVHPGMAKNRMVNALRAASWLIDRLPPDHLPETTELRESYLHPYVIGGEVGRLEIKLLVRGFEVRDLEEREEDLRRLARETEEAFPGCRVEVNVQESYRNMKVVLDRFPEVVGLAEEAVRRAGLQPKLGFIRGGTDGARLCFMGLPTPNIFAGGVNFHGYQEWVSLEWMAKATETFVHLARLWGEKEPK